MSDVWHRVNALDESAFTKQFGSLYEHSPWIAQKAWEQRPFRDEAELLTAFQSAVRDAPLDKQMALIRAHPELARRVGVDASLTETSRQEQASAGLNRLSLAEHARFTALNDAYGTRFSMPFIICVRLSEKDRILAEMERRIRNTPDEERRTALAEIDKIAALRCKDVLKEMEENA
ncbi:hypothetical protein AA0472_0241 [Acetobacter estunensis NRIC 0472]|uniref:2-oxo-4-hydroxy-4-carboxy-5-ureidoimidazoline decarboxylase n=1 Tax=Acetobacter estunensis TaxID=104097 RepID=A0A967EHS6_9PROT|nr:2-oxo-4-hydroxy-4-carboxy-5-ureidoimidazoline decarboxylase [Acetobacter estunensis]NHO54127.1 2-oxo-4-hydroxy-4-carboxy-5-ureidoimidazoline decarboxylase [Acetobacter estunensis]GBQ20780.1 hypothetical protein AA0472_0241 [Acetobacter estunensis NRIC 0472]